MSRPIAIEEMVRRFKARHKTSHLLKIDNFSLLTKYHIHCVESSVFDLGGHKWKLYMYPYGDDYKAKSDHVSIFFENQDSIGVKLFYQIFVVNQLEKRGHPHNVTCDFDRSREPTKRGYTKLIPYADLEKEGYLVEDCCMFGVKLIGIEPGTHGTAECFSLIEKPPKNIFTWRITNFSSLEHYKCHFSSDFVVGTRKWSIQVYPFGSGTDLIRKRKGLPGQESFSVYLVAKDSINNEPKAKTYVKYKLRVMDQVNRKHHVEKAGYDWLYAGGGYVTGFKEFMPLEKLGKPYLVDDRLYVGVEFEVISVTKYC